MQWRIWRLAARSPAVRIQHSRSHPSGGHHTVVMRDGRDRAVGRLDYQLCHACRTGRVEQISVALAWQRQGLAREAIHEALARGPGYHWVTSRQSREGRLFFAAMALETGAAFTRRGKRCPHMHGRTG
ncbi:GNAT family N-acetyltransferase [Streptomyces sp. P1-3]|uniref:GNAT family N-acetyltransferase n=1 Tax=Streptomyces sp. P1-3 TaxID=3421658 RepID=UPI003D35AC96